LALKPSGRRLLAAAVAMALLAVTPPAYAATTTTEAQPNGDADSRTITLITGDKVTMGPAGTTSVLGADGEPVGAHVITAGPDTYVYPDSALPYVTAGLVDKSLFNITELLADGYDDAHIRHLPLIVTYETGRLRAQRTPAGATTVRALPSIGGAAVTEDRDKAAAFWTSLTGGATGSTSPARTTPDPAPALAAGVEKVWLDGKVKAKLSDTVAQIGAPEVWAGGDTGQGVDVAVLDTGVDAAHPDLAGRIKNTASFVPGEDVTDRHGHGTHVASTIVGTGAASDGKEKGVAPGADLHVGKVLSDSGQGLDSWIIAGMEWAARDEHAKVISMSLGTDSPSDGTDPMSQAVNALTAETGTLFVIAAGNAGLSGDRTIGSPGAADAALTVGAVDGADHLADFSSRGPRLVDDALKPEITAPGVNVLAARSQYAPGEGPYMTLSGTSMATPHVAGAAALLAAAHPDWTGAKLKDALVSTAKPTPDYTPYQAGSGRVDIAAATRSTVFATGSAYLGIHSPTKEPGAKPQQTLTYTNAGDAPATLTLSFDDSELPDGMWSLSTSQVTVPAHGQSTVTLTADLSRAKPGFSYAGQLLATAADGTPAAHTIVGVSAGEKPSRLSITVTGRNGEPMSGRINLMREGDPAGTYYSFDTTSGYINPLVPVGAYSVWVWGDVQGTHGPSSRGLALMSAPTVVVDGDNTLKLDASTAHQIKAVTPKEAADATVRVDYHRTLGDTSAISDSYMVSDPYDSVWTNSTAKPDTGELSVTARWRKIQPQLSVRNGERSYDDLWLLPGGGLLPEGTSTLDVVFAGDGKAADYSGIDAKGKIAVIRYGDTDKQVPAAVAAGVKLLLIVNDVTGRLREPVKRTPLTLASITKDEGEQLISEVQAGPVRLDVTSHPATAYLYDLVRTWNGAVPRDVTYQPKERDLAKVDVDFRNDPADEVDEYRFDASRIGSTRRIWSNGHRTDWVTADATWMSEAEIPRKALQWGGSVSYRPGHSTYEQWFGPIQRPRINDAVTLPRRTGDSVEIKVPAWGDSGADHAGLAAPGQLSESLALYQGNTLVSQAEGEDLDTDLHPGRLGYKLAATTERDPAVYPYSTRTRTTWRFTSGTAAEGKPAALPLIQLDYGVDTDASGKADRSAKLTLTPSHLPGGPDSHAIHSAALDVSYDDGVTWHEQRLDQTHDGWRTKLRAPATAQHVTLRATAKDAYGDSVEQTIVRAFALK
jgi:subtilisin family serine protease